MSREIQPYIKNDDGVIIGYVDDNTFVGYDFIQKRFYVKNLDTKTVATDAHEAKAIFDITAPGNTVPVSEIEKLAVTLEPITDINYTLEDTGKYIKTIYFNNYQDYSIEYNEPYLFIQGSNEMWDMSSSVGKESVKEFFWSYFTYHIGLEVNLNLMGAIVDYFIKIQSPYVYNVIQPREDISEDLYYTNQFIVNNPNKTSKGEYTGTKNPDNVFSYKGSYQVISFNSIEGYIEVFGRPVANVGDRIQITGASEPNLEYTIDQIKRNPSNVNNNFIYVNEPIESELTTDSNCTMYILAYRIHQIGYGDYIEITGSRGISKIVDNIVYIAGWLNSNDFVADEDDNSFYINYGDGDIRGPFAITAVSPNAMTPTGTTITGGTLTLSDNPGRNYTSKVGVENASIEVRKSYDTNENSITIYSSVSPDFEEDDIFKVVNTEKWNNEYTVDHLEPHPTNPNFYKIWLKYDGELERYVDSECNYNGILQERYYSDMILMNMTYSKRADKMPTGEFMFDDNQQFTNYLTMYNIVTPTSTNYGDLNQIVTMKYHLGNDLLFNKRNTTGNIIVEKEDDLIHIEGSEENPYAYVIVQGVYETYYHRYIYLGQTEFEGETIYEWTASPEAVYMNCKGLYSEIYTD